MHGGLTRQTGLHLRIVLRPVIGRTGSAKPAEASGAANDLVAGIPQRLDDRDAFRDLVGLPSNLHGHHLGPEDFLLVDDVLSVEIGHLFYCSTGYAMESTMAFNVWLGRMALVAFSSLGR